MITLPNWLTRYDNFMTKQVGKVGEIYQQITGRSYKELARVIYIASAAELSIAGIANYIANKYDIFIMDAALMYFALSDSRNPEFKSPIEEESMDEAIGLNKNWSKIQRTLLSIIPLIGLPLNIYDRMYGLPENDIFEYVKGFEGITSFIGMSLYAFAKYLSNSNVPKPPENSMVGKAFDRIKSVLTHLPNPEPANNYVVQTIV